MVKSIKLVRALELVNGEAERPEIASAGKIAILTGATNQYYWEMVNF